MLGYQEPFTLDKPTGGLMLTYFKVNDHQYIEVFPELKEPNRGPPLAHRLRNHRHAKQLRDYLASHGVKVPDSRLRTGLDGNLSMMLKDPDGHNVEFVRVRARLAAQPATSASSCRTRASPSASSMWASRCADQAAADRFYKDILGFHDIWHGGMTDDRTDWVDMRVPDGTDWLEYMLNVHNPSPRTLGVMHHLALGVPSVPGGLQDGASRAGSSREKPQDRPRRQVAAQPVRSRTARARS